MLRKLQVILVRLRNIIKFWILAIIPAYVIINLMQEILDKIDEARLRLNSLSDCL
jgi:hypothetical protein